MTSILRCGIAATIGGLVGAAIWAAITYFTGYEIGWIAWGVGALVGFAVRTAAGNETGVKLGAVAVAGAVVALLLGKYAAVHYLIQKEFEAVGTITVTAEDMQANIADEVAEEWESEGKELNWPEDLTDEDAEAWAETGAETGAGAEGAYPADVWAEAGSRWAKMAPEEQQRQIEERQKMFQELAGVMRDQITLEGFKSSFSPIDLLFFGLAIYTAFKLGAGNVEEQTAEDQTSDEQTAEV